MGTSKTTLRLRADLKDTTTKTAFDNQEKATILAALRYWQADAKPDLESDLLSAEEIECLCARIDAAGEHTQAEVELVTACRDACSKIAIATEKGERTPTSKAILDALRILRGAIKNSGIPALSSRP